MRNGNTDEQNLSLMSFGASNLPGQSELTFRPDTEVNPREKRPALMMLNDYQSLAAGLLLVPSRTGPIGRMRGKLLLMA